MDKHKDADQLGENILETSTKSVPDEWIKAIRDEQAHAPLNIAIVGGGRACRDLLQILDGTRLSRLNMKILGVADINPEAPGLLHAQRLNLFATTDFKNLFNLKGLNLLIELTGSEKVRKAVIKAKPPDISLMDHTGAMFLWELFQIEAEKTKLEREHQKLQEKEKKHIQIILDSLPYRIMVVNMDMTIDKVNETFLREFNLKNEDVIGGYCYKVRYGLDRPCNQSGKECFMQEVTKNRRVFSTIQECLEENGEQHFEVITLAPILDEQGEMVQTLEASRDVTDRIRLEQEVQKSKIFFQNVIQSTVDGIVVVDTKGYVLIFNDGMERLTGYSSAEINHLTSFYDIDLARENMIKMRTEQYGPLGMLNPTTMSITTKSGEKIPVTLTASIITDNGKEMGSVGVFTDMREILKMRKDLEEVRLQLVQSEKTASIGRMAAGVAHEINNPLSGVLIYAELLKENLKDQPQNSSDAQEIIDQTIRCKKIVSELLEFSRQSLGTASSFRLEHLINKCLNLLINQASFQNILVIKNISPDIPETVGDMGQLQQVFTNLFINAAQAMEGKGKLTINADYDPDKKMVNIQVADTGHGIPVELKDKVFDIFFTTKPVGGGTGLGLSISQNIIKLHGGNITVECPEEGGTLFKIDLPIESNEVPFYEPVFMGMDDP